MKFTTVAALLAISSSATARTFIVYNSCSYTIWPAIFTDPNRGSVVPAFTTGWAARPFSSVSFSVPDNWKAGRIWGRTGCNFTNNSGPNSCLTGGCNGGLVCDPTTGTGVPPATLAEFNLGSSLVDNYAVSVVDGTNIPMRISNSVGCPVAECPVDLNVNCPASLRGPLDSTGKASGCKSACFANIDGTPSNSANCCTGTHNSQGTCPSSGVAFYPYFKGNCPRTYAYAFDEPSGTAQFACSFGNNKADYFITFCP
ncbi:thaumatin [Lyophyllum atratum]|nr:thaumatin [Lyophyllum atratum]